MSRLPGYGTIVLPAAFGALMMAVSPSIAQAQTTNPTTPAATSAAPSNASAKPNGGLEMSHNAWRSTELDGAAVYNDQGTNVGTVDDMLLDSQGKVSNVVLSVGGFLGMGTKYVEVPFSKLKFEPSKGSATGNNTNGNNDYSIVLPGVTKDSLKAMTSFNY